MRRLTRWVTGAVLAAALSGCADRALELPTNSETRAPAGEEVVAVLAVPSGGLVVGNPAAGKAAIGLNGTAEDIIGPNGGRIRVLGQGFSYASFNVPEGALEDPVSIRMAVSGVGGGLQIEFGPSGLHFLKPATLTLLFPHFGLTDEDLKGYLLTEDGSHEVDADVRFIGPLVKMTLYISHFSIYSPSDGEDQSAMHDNEGYGGYGGWWSNSTGYVW